MRFDLVCRTSQNHGNIIQHVLHHQQSLGHTKAPEGGVGGQVGPAGSRMAPQVWDVVDVVEKKQNLFCNLEEEKTSATHHRNTSRQRGMALLQTHKDSSTVFPALA